MFTKKKKVFKKLFQRSPKKGLEKKFKVIYKILTIKKIVRCPLAKDRGIFEDLKLQGQGLDLQGQGLQNVFSRTPPLVGASLIISFIGKPDVDNIDNTFLILF